MKKWITTSTALMLLVPLGLLAVEERQKCEAEADVCLRDMAQQIRKKGWVGIRFDYEEEGGRVTLSRVFEDSPAEAAGLQVGDVLLELNGEAYTHDNEQKLREIYYGMKPGDTLSYTIERAGKRMNIEVELGRIPDALIAQWIGMHLLEDHVEVEEEEVAEKP